MPQDGGQRKRSDAMKEFFDVTVLAVLQGVAEFLPISSSGHLVIGQHLLDLEIPGMRLDLFLHVGTLFSIFAFYRRRIGGLLAGMFVPWREDNREAWGFAGKIVCSALPACAVYVCFLHEIEALFENAKMVGALLMFTGAVLVGTRLLPRGGREVSLLRALWMGAMQAVALLPGVSRSGMTLAAARSGRVDAEKAAEFSFLMSAPLIAGGALLDVAKDISGSGAAADAAAAQELSWGLIAYGAVVSAVVGYFSLVMLLKALKGRWFWMFGPYCFAAGLLTLIFCKSAS